MERKPISDREILSTLVAKFGGVETLRHFLDDAMSDLNSMEIGVGDNNPMQAVRSLESARHNLSYIRMLVDNKEYRGGVEKEIKV